jgi:hypothetical protein
MSAFNGSDLCQVRRRFECPVFILCSGHPDRLLCCHGYHKRETDYHEAQEMDASSVIHLTVVSDLHIMNILAGTVAFAATPITARLATISARHIISAIGGYYAVQSIGCILSSGNTDGDFFSIGLEV